MQPEIHFPGGQTPCFSEDKRPLCGLSKEDKRPHRKHPPKEDKRPLLYISWGKVALAGEWRSHDEAPCESKTTRQD